MPCTSLVPQVCSMTKDYRFSHSITLWALYLNGFPTVWRGRWRYVLPCACPHLGLDRWLCRSCCFMCDHDVDDDLMSFFHIENAPLCRRLEVRAGAGFGDGISRSSGKKQNRKVNKIKRGKKVCTCCSVNRSLHFPNSPSHLNSSGCLSWFSKHFYGYEPVHKKV